MLRPGFHSGTIPKLVDKLDHAKREGDTKSIHTTLQKIHHAKEQIRRFIERDLVLFLQGSRGWNGNPVSVGAITCSKYRVVIDLLSPSFSSRSMRLAFEEQSGWLTAEFVDPGWLHRLDDVETYVLRTALAGLYKKAGVELVQEQLHSLLETSRLRFDITYPGLVAWPEQSYASYAFYHLRDENELKPKLTSTSQQNFPTLTANELVFKKSPIPWQRWVEAWTRDQEGQGVPRVGIEAVQQIAVSALPADAPCPEHTEPPEQSNNNGQNKFQELSNSQQ